MKFDKLTNPLVLAAVNVVLAAIAFVSFRLPRFSNLGSRLGIVILLLLVADIALVLRDFFRSGTRSRALVAVSLWLPVLFLFGMILQWEGPVYVAASGNPPRFQMRGLAGVCTVDIYGPQRNGAEGYGNDIEKLWSITHKDRFPFEVEFTYGEVPSEFEQITPTDGKTPPPLDSNMTYKIAVSRCMGAPQMLSLRGDVLSEYKSGPNR